ncbi:hypothetical protein RFI_27965 [Reticulomyxa filosa]|uniref:Protein kinase domain-containing protein n=1 Tax=Reticulomyxa filosa TaxID=46433 RepID=X6M727_RETFI|nr:hypothetical protein RFI_27965 [Reticulomyxa filosa]|eukprot:ETO09411.1 hypothetical protein RFI_27965 [Reticulomyxa filosa]
MVASNGYCKLTDFGFAKIRNHTCTLCGTPQYLAPEVIRCRRQGFEVDWWCVGVFIYEMVYGFSPFEVSRTKEGKSIFDRILEADVYFPPIPSLSEECKNLITLLLQKNERERLGSGIGATGVQAVKNHKWFQVYKLSRGWEGIEKQTATPPQIPEIRNNKDPSCFRFLPQDPSDDELPDDPDDSSQNWCDEF